jgi:hypothetical protein
MPDREDKWEKQLGPHLGPGEWYLEHDEEYFAKRTGCTGSCSERLTGSRLWKTNPADLTDLGHN